MPTTLPPFSEADYRQLAVPGYGYLEHQWGYSPEAEASGWIMEIYRDGTYMLDVRNDAGETEEEIVVKGDARLFEVDMPW